MRTIDVVALPSRKEPFGIVALEEWAAGKPVVATAHAPIGWYEPEGSSPQIEHDSRMQ